MRLTRIAVGPIRLGEMPVGSVRTLAKEEIASLKRFHATVKKDIMKT
jgi:16S rRNA U516 pseudouridylate synthase RsuA-like enzyme